MECQCLSQGGLGLGKAGFFLWEVTVLRPGGGSPQTCRQCVLGVTGKSEKQIIAVRYPFASWIKHREISFVGRKEGALALVTLLLITGANEVFSHPMLLLLLLSRFSRV